MEKKDLDTFVATKSYRYFSGTTAGKIVIISLDKEPILICSRLERDQALREGWIKDVRAFSGWKAPLRRGEKVHFTKPHELLAECLKELNGTTIGYEALSRETVRKLRLLHPASYQELPQLAYEVRKIKDPEEIRLLKKSAEIATRGMRAAQETIRPSVTELEVAAQAEYEMRKSGSEGVSFPTIVASGRNSWLPHASASEKKIKKGELVVVDLGAFFKGYASDCTRTFEVSPNKKQRKIVEVVKRAQRAAISKIGDGILVKEVCAAAEKVIKKAGFLKYSPHGLGHGVGLEIHEPPSLYPGSKEILRNKMVTTVEPGVYIPKVGGARWEDMILVKKKPENLTLKYLS